MEDRRMAKTGGKYRMKDVTDKYIEMIESFEMDFVLARDNPTKFKLGDLQLKGKLLEDISLLEKLSYGLRYGKLKIVGDIE